MGFESANICFKVTVAVSLLALITHVVGFVTPNWIENDVSGRISGLWKFCAGENCLSYSFYPVQLLSARLKAEQAMATIGLILLFGSVVGSALIVFLDSFRPRAPLVAVCALTAGIAITVCVILLGTEISPPIKIGYSLGLSAAGAVLAFITACLMFVGHCRQ